MHKHTKRNEKVKGLHDHTKEACENQGYQSVTLGHRALHSRRRTIFEPRAWTRPNLPLQKPLRLTDGLGTGSQPDHHVRRRSLTLTEVHQARPADADIVCLTPCPGQDLKLSKQWSPRPKSWRPRRSQAGLETAYLCSPMPTNIGDTRLSRTTVPIRATTRQGFPTVSDKTD